MRKTISCRGLTLDYSKPDHLLGLTEVLFLDIYRASLLKKDDVVLDLGAGVGDFSILASKLVGPKGRVIALEPNPEDYGILKSNIERNNCLNITPLNVGAAQEPGTKEIDFWGRKITFRADTLENILSDLKVGPKIDFIKMDIEGFETEVIAASLNIVKKARVISLELHRTQEVVDRMLEPHGFAFAPISRRKLWINFMKSMILYPQATLQASLSIIVAYPKLIPSGMRETMQKERLVSGVYTRKH